jgi:hypothetical protein
VVVILFRENRVVVILDLGNLVVVMERNILDQVVKVVSVVVICLDQTLNSDDASEVETKMCF